MTESDDWTLIAHALGDLPPRQSAAIEEAAAGNPDLAAKLAVLRLAAGSPEAAPAQPAAVVGPPRPARRRFLKQLAASVGGVALLGGAAYAGYEAIRDRPLLADDFNDEWLDTRIWDTHRGRKGVREEGGHLRLLNRGSVVTLAEFPGPIELELDWLWLDLESDPLYTDNLSVGLRTSGNHERQHAYKLLDGVVLVFTSHAGAVYLFDTRTPTGSEHVSTRGEVKFSAGKWYHLRVTDDGTRIAVYVSGPEIDRKYTHTPVIAVDITGEYTARRVAFYNREYVGGANHESRIDNVVIRKLPGR